MQISVSVKRYLEFFSNFLNLADDLGFGVFNFVFNYNTNKYYNRFTVGKILIYKNLSKGSGYFRTLWVGELLVIDMISLLELGAVLVYLLFNL